ncbi:MAG TPA: glycosyltransferase [Nitrospiraceae bacterium]|jgi:GT2 family glycosyltransferase|nr:glycosyltransferase [Nitrospiraceae bacterium]
MKLSLVTGTRNRPTDFKRLLDSIDSYTPVSWELVVGDASDEPLECGHPNVRILPERPRLGCVKGYNRAFKACLGEWVLYLNDDAEVCRDYATAAIAFMEAHPQIGLGALHYSHLGDPFHVNSAWGAIYANFGIIRRTLGNYVSWFDEDLEMYGNDNSLTFRVLLAGYGVADIPSARLLHHCTDDVHREENQRSRRRDNEILRKKYWHLRDVWLKTFQRHYVKTATVSWPEGVRV